MPRFFFNIRNGSGFTEDEEGRTLADAEEARREALKGARDLIADEAKQGRIDLAGSIDVTDEAGAPVLSVPFRDAVTIDG